MTSLLDPKIIPRIEAWLAKKTVNVFPEVEIRFKSFSGSSLSVSEFKRVDDYLTNRGYPFEEYTIKDSNYNITMEDGKTRRNYRTSEFGREGKVIHLFKDSQIETNEDYKYTLSFATETKLEAIPVEILQQNTFQRNKTRKSFFLGENKEDALLRVDLTIVDPINFVVGRLDASTYEVEMECLKPEGASDFLKETDALFKIIHNTLIIYTNDQRNEITSWIISKFGRRIKDTVDLISRAKDIKYRNLIDGEIVNGKYPYYVTYKTDGLRKFLVLSSSGVWLIFGQEYNRITVKSIGFNKSIFDGELIDIAKGRYQIFDCLVIEDRVITQLSLTDRLKQVKNLLDKYNVKGNPYLSRLTLETKPFTKLTLENFFSTMVDMLDNRTKLSYHQDGLIFESDGPYYEQIYKWKEPEDLTIDFWAIANVSGFTLYTSDMQPFRPEGKEFSIPASTKIENQQVGEFEFRDNAFHLRKIRADKLRPNTPETAMAIWQVIRDPITADVLKGRSLKLVRKYHNHIKRQLFNTITTKSTLLDIGTGRGGDLTKMKNVTTLYAVEPNSDNRSELLRRIGQYREQKEVIPRNITLIDAGGQETKKIASYIGKNKVNVITFMLSLSFFWQSKDMLDQLMQTIETFADTECRILFLTIDGKAVRDMIKTKGETLVFNGATLTLKNNVVYIDIPGTIVEKQVEYLVDLDDLTKRLENLGFTLSFSEVADKEKLLSPDEKAFTQLYRYGAYERKAKTLKSMRTTDVRRAPLKMIDPNDVQPLTVPWVSENVVRIGAIPEGSCFIHAVLTAIYPPYQKTISRGQRETMAAIFRRDLAYHLGEKNTKYPEYINWFTIGNGVYPKGALMALYLEKLDSPADDRFRYDCAIRHINSTEWLREDTIRYVAEYLGVDIYIVSAYADNIEPVIAHVYGKSKAKIIINATGNHFETIGILKSNGIQTVFSDLDTIIVELNKQINPNVITEFDVQVHQDNIIEFINDAFRVDVCDEKGCRKDEIKMPDTYLKLPKTDYLRKYIDPLLEKVNTIKSKRRVTSPVINR